MSSPEVKRKPPNRAGFYILILAALIIAIFESVLFGLIVLAGAVAYYTWRMRSSRQPPRPPPIQEEEQQGEGGTTEGETRDSPQNPKEPT